MNKDKKSIIESQLHRIMRKTGRKPTQCKCKLCQEQCHQPCLGTPQDILGLIDAGYADRLTPTAWVAGMVMGVCPAPVPMVQARLEEDGWCTFFKDGLCELHDKGLKPTEGRLSHHTIRADNWSPKRSISWHVAREWLLPDNGAEIVEICNKMTGLEPG